MSYGLYIGKNLTSDGHAWLAGYGDEPSSHWLEIIPRKKYQKNQKITVGMTKDADMPGKQIKIPQIPETYKHIRVSYSYYLGAPSPLTNGGLNEHGVAVRDIWSTSRKELIDMTPKNQTGPNYSDFARIVLERAKTAKQAVKIVADLIKKYGESSYGGNSHIFADSNEAWVMIQFAGGVGLWAAERLGPNSIRASRPGYIEEIPIDEKNNPNYLYSDNLIKFCKKKGWYLKGNFNVNKILGDKKGKWEGVRWIEGEIKKLSQKLGKITLQDVMWSIRTTKLTGDTAGYGQIVPLHDPSYNDLRMLWHSPIGAVAAPFSPIFIGQTIVPEEFMMHRYLTVGESHRFLDERKKDIKDSISLVNQGVESTTSAVYECKRLLYLILQNEKLFHYTSTKLFENREKKLIDKTTNIFEIAKVLLKKNEKNLSEKILNAFSVNELRKGLKLVQTISKNMETHLRQTKGFNKNTKPVSFEQIW
tara:strand:+ start:209 stop:1633 length:1425 start_codon:yes stop_codon:yes gene_type:complete